MARKQVKPDQVRVRVLGATELQIGSRRVGMNTEALFALALYLTTRAGERIARPEVLEVFWTEGAEESRRHAMRQMMYRLRQKGLELDEDGEFLRLDPARVESDLRDCLQADWPERAGAAAVEAALALGPTFSARLAAPFLDWFDGVRAEVAAQHRKAAQKQITQARREGRWMDVERWSVAVLRTDPLNEEATLARAESAAMSGSKVTALEILDTYLAEIGQVAPELGKPAMVLRKRIAERRADWSRRGAAEVALVGRAQLMTRLTAVLDGASRSDGTSAVLIGAPGIGKSRVAREALNYAALQGFRCIEARAESSLSARPLGVVAMVLEQLLGLPGSIGIAPASLQLLRDVAGRDPSRMPDFSEILDQDSICRSLSDLIRALSETTRLAFLVDDGHNVDTQSREVLGGAIRYSKAARVAWIVTTRGGPSAWRPGDITLRVGPLDTLDSQRIALLVAESLNRPMREERAASIAKAAGGNPLFLREIATHDTFGTSGHLPLSLQDIIHARLASLDDQALRLLRVSALLGRSATLERTAALSLLPAPEFSRLLETLESESILNLEAGITLGLHECWQTALIESTPPLTMATLALECANTITVDEGRRASLDDLWRAGTLFRQAGAMQRAFDCLVKSADQLLVNGMHGEAQSVLDQAMLCVNRSSTPIAVTSRLCEVALAQGDYPRVEQLTRRLPETAQSVIETGDDPSDWVLALSHRMDAVGKTSINLTQDYEALLEACSSIGASALSRQYAAFVGARLSVWTDNPVSLRAFRAACRSSVETQGHTLASAFVEMIHAAELGEEADLRCASSLLTSLDTSKVSPRLRLQSMRFRSIALRMFGLVTESREIAIAVFNECEKQRQFELAAGSAEFLAFLHLDQNAEHEARRWVETGFRLETRIENRLISKGLRHAADRLELQFGDPAVLAARMSDRLGQLESDPNARRRAGELLTYALAHLEAERNPAEVASILREFRPLLDRSQPSFLLDYPAEILARCLHKIAPEEARRFVATFADRRRAVFNRPLVPFLERLRSSSAFPTATLT